MSGGPLGDSNLAPPINCCEEPFRIFFPIGALLALLGVALWPLYYSGAIAEYPSILHARLMIEGFLASFIIGFLGTAGPRITSAPHFTRTEVLLLVTLDLLAAGLHLGGSHRAADFLFAFLLAAFALILGKRFAQRADTPPPNFVLVALGLLNGVIGALLLAIYQTELYSAPYRIGASLLEQGFVLFPILGVGPYLLARLLNISRADALPESRVLPPGWLPRAVFALTIGLTIDATFVAETLGWSTPAAWLRAGAVLIYVALRTARRGRSFLGDCLRFGLAAVVIGLAVEAIWPHYRIGALHILFISGFSFIVLTVSIRVIFGHSGNAHLSEKRMPFFIVAGVLIFLAMISRYVADIVPAARIIHLVAAALFWIAALLIWMVKVLPKVTIAERDDVG
ncbi:MAG: NnrS family protein [Verrucomicrobiota bacterium]|nr:NnrS family protein [Verrucomicrobiota bacterium]